MQSHFTLFDYMTGKIFDVKKETLNLRSVEFEVIIYILHNYSLRISEVLRLSLNCLIENYQIAVKLSKCNDYIIIRDSDLWNILFKIFSSRSSNTFDFSYKECYNLMLKSYPQLIIRSSGHNNKVTHSFRYVNAKKINSLFKNKELNKAVLHHKSLTSQKYYLVDLNKKVIKNNK